MASSIARSHSSASLASAPPPPSPAALAASSSAPKDSPEMQYLLTHQRQVHAWLQDVEARIAELEAAYLDETAASLGNIVRGFDVDAKPLLGRSRMIEDKEKVFSNSSYRLSSYSLMKAQQQQQQLQMQDGAAASSAAGAPAHKRARKSTGAGRGRSHAAAAAAAAADGWEDEF